MHILNRYLLIVGLLTCLLAPAQAAIFACKDVFYQKDYSSKVSELELQMTIDELASKVSNPKAGFFGPQSLMWRVWREHTIKLQALSSVALQIANPAIANAISKTPSGIHQPVKRYNATTAALDAFIFGDVETAIAMARRLHQVHASFRGKTKTRGAYEANNPELLMWVWATLIDGSLRAYDNFVAPMSPKQKEQYYQEAKKLFFLSGIPVELVPKDFPEFLSYFRQQLQDLRVTSEAREIMTQLLSNNGIGTIVSEKYGKALEPAGLRLIPILTAYLLPPEIAKAYGFKQTMMVKVSGSTLQLIKPLIRTLPSKVRYKKEYFEALKR